MSDPTDVRGRGRPDGSLHPLARYLLHQVPGWLALLVGIFVVDRLGWLDLAWGGVLLAAVVGKDLVLWRWMRSAYAPSTLHGVDALLHRVGRVERALDPEGVVRIGPELWRARTARRDAPVAAGAQVVVRDVHGLTLIVESTGRPPA